MSSTLPGPSPKSASTYQAHSTNPEGNNAYPAPPASRVHATSLHGSLPMDTLYLPPFWEKPRDSHLTIALIHALRSERRAESCLIRKRLARVKIEHELYIQMEQTTNHRLNKADNATAISRGGLRACGLFPVVGKEFHDGDSELGSDVETPL